MNFYILDSRKCVEILNSVRENIKAIILHLLRDALIKNFYFKQFDLLIKWQIKQRREKNHNVLRY